MVMYDISQYNCSRFGDNINCVCDECGSFFKRTKRRLCASLGRNQTKTLCSKKCSHNSQKSKRTERRCLNCSNLILKYGRKFCSSKCSAIYNKPNLEKAIKELVRYKHSKTFNPNGSIKLNYSMVSITCKNCHKNKEVKHWRSKELKFFNQGFCSIKCRQEFNKNSVQIVDCPQCKKAFLPLYRATKLNTKYGSFCSKSCRMKFYNKNVKIAKSRNKSRPEDLIEQKIKSDFCNLIIKRQDRETLPSELELDIYIPEIKLAIEINGPVHYMPIYGEERLTLVKNKDATKHLEAYHLGISLLTIDVSYWQSKKTQDIKSEEAYQTIIKPLINEKILAGGWIRTNIASTEGGEAYETS